MKCHIAQFTHKVCVCLVKKILCTDKNFINNLPYCYGCQRAALQHCSFSKNVIMVKRAQWKLSEWTLNKKNSNNNNWCDKHVANSRFSSEYTYTGNWKGHQRSRGKYIHIFFSLVFLLQPTLWNLDKKNVILGYKNKIP